MSFNDLCVFCFEKVLDKKQNKENALIQDKNLKILIGSETSKKVNIDKKLDWQRFYEEIVELKTIGSDFGFR